MIDILERFILEGTFILLLIFGIVLLVLKEELVRTPNIHRCLGVSTILAACAILCVYLDLVFPDSAAIQVVKIIVAIASILIYCCIGIRISKSALKKIKVVVTAQSSSIDGDTADEAEEEDAEEAADEDDKNATDENGEPIRQPSEDNMEDLVFFQRLEALMARKRLFSEQDITREQIATEIGTNRTYLIRSIKLATGMTFNEYITNLRTSYAATLLVTTDEPLDYIGTLAGFRSKSAYYRAFTAANNCTPSEYRNRNK